MPTSYRDRSEDTLVRVVSPLGLEEDNLGFTIHLEAKTSPSFRAEDVRLSQLLRESWTM
jgi:hypothetical protein